MVAFNKSYCIPTDNKVSCKMIITLETLSDYLRQHKGNLYFKLYVFCFDLVSIKFVYLKLLWTKNALSL